MIEYTESSIFSLRVDAVVNPVNTKGVSGAGLALEFKMRHPEAHSAYVTRCRRGLLRVGEVYAVKDGTMQVVHFPTKTHWRQPSELTYIRDGLVSLRAWLQSHRTMVKSIAIPALGCGLGGLSWADVRPLIEEALADLPTRVIVCEPR